MTAPDSQTPAPPPESRADASAPDTGTDTGELPEGIDAARKLRAENRSLRDRLRATEGDLAAAVTRLAAAQHAEVERLAAEVLVDPADIWRAQPDVSAFADEQFQNIVGDKVIESAKALIQNKPHLARPPSAPPPSQRPIEGLRPGARAEEPVTTPTWAQALRGG